MIEGTIKYRDEGNADQNAFNDVVVIYALNQKKQQTQTD
jgi:hypothetical protein